MHAAVTVSLLEIVADGRTAYERSLGKQKRKKRPVFGECGLYLPFDRTRDKTHNLRAKFLNGVYLGLRLKINEMYIGTKTGLCPSRSDQAKDRARAFCLGRAGRSFWYTVEANASSTAR